MIAPFEGLTLSHDGGCSFSKVSETSGEVVIDISIDGEPLIRRRTSTGSATAFPQPGPNPSLDNGVS
ncbi:MAG: hypothetical protein U0165_05015 [Polyangiaceae bacterium]